jgi:membrane-associated phospholipid phosphatase
MFFAKIISVVLHPFIISSTTFLIFLIYSDIPVFNRVVIMTVALIATVVFPMLHVILMKKRGDTISLDIPEREKRIYPFLLSILIYVIALGILLLIQSPRPILILMWAYVFNTTIATIVTRYWKISIHGMALGGPVAALGIVVSPSFYWLTPSALLILFSRVKLKAHTPTQVITGFILGFLLTCIHFKLLLLL